MQNARAPIWILLLATSWVLLACNSCSSTSVDTVQPPNVIIILADDMGLGDLVCYNAESKVPTPHLDALAASGMRFSDAHTPSAVCTPTRYGVLTGRYCWRTRIKSGVLGGTSTNLIDEARVTLPDLMRQAGYQTAAIGKWHLGLGSGEKTDWDVPLVPGPLEHGFDTFFGIPASLDMAPYVWVRDRGLEAAATETVAASQQARHGGGGFWRAGPMAPGFDHGDVLPRVTAEAVRFIESEATASGKPFFLYWALPAPHTPWMPTDKFRGASEAGVYGDFAAMVDDAVGQVMAALEVSGLAENTLVIFTSDNGAHWTPEDIAKFGHRANHQRRGQKADIWEGGHRVPFLVRWPGRIEPGSQSDDLICLTDLMSTLSRVVGRGVPVDAGEDSVVIRSLADAWAGGASGGLGSGNQASAAEAADANRVAFASAAAPASELKTRRDIIHHSFKGHFAIRAGDWKLMEKLGSGGFSKPQTREPAAGEAPGQLYNLASDPKETQNLYNEQPEKVAQLQAMLDAYRAQGHSRFGVVAGGSADE
ncbi:MAG: arylsulfatase [Planctomycetes bacterium]|nr:arylsulfatase [Planctomycetota bacterium]